MNLFCFVYRTRYMLYNITVNRSEAEGGLVVAKTVVRKNESLDDALRRFKREVSKVPLLKLVNVNITLNRVSNVNKNLKQLVKQLANVTNTNF